jgi:hypothetical protein
MQIDSVPADFLHKWVVYGQFIDTINPLVAGSWDFIRFHNNIDS